MRHLIGIQYNNRIMIPENLITTIGNTVNECARSKQSETGKQTGSHRAVHRVLWSGTTVPRGTLTHGPRLSRCSLTTICFPLIQKHSLESLCVKIGHLPSRNSVYFMCKWSAAPQRSPLYACRTPTGFTVCTKHLYTWEWWLLPYRMLLAL